MKAAWLTLALLTITMGLILWVGWLVRRRIKRTPCPYCGFPLRAVNEMHYKSYYRLGCFLRGLPGYDNPRYDLRRAVFCRETGRVFPNAVNWRGNITLDWNFFTDRVEGNFVSWGSLLPEQQRGILEAHGKLDEFQTTYSSAEASPRRIEREYILSKPGPLYVDIETKIVMGWQCVPETELEVLVVKHPPKKEYS